MVTVAVIPARGGSKRIPKKNMIDFGGFPLIFQTIRTAIDSNMFDQVIVSTDDLDTAEFAEKIGATVPGLRELFNDDEATSSTVTTYEIDRYFKNNNVLPNFVYQLMPTCPFRTINDLRSVERFLANNEDRSVVTCHTLVGGNAWWASTIDHNFAPKFLFPEKLKTGSQDLPPIYVPNGAIWASKVSLLKRYESFYNPAVSFFNIPWLSGLDIDTPEDLEIAQSLISRV
jgi:CMP-N-acetylneuraminic acid synthetase